MASFASAVLVMPLLLGSPSTAASQHLVPEAYRLVAFHAVPRADHKTAWRGPRHASPPGLVPPCRSSGRGLEQATEEGNTRWRKRQRRMSLSGPQPRRPPGQIQRALQVACVPAPTHYAPNVVSALTHFIPRLHVIAFTFSSV